MRGFVAVLRKELAHLRRQRSTLAFALAIPAAQLMIFGFAANVTIESIPLVVLDLDGRQESRGLIGAVEATGTLVPRGRVFSHEALQRAIASGDAQAGLVIPADYSERLLRREQAHVQVLVDGSDAQVATTVVNTVGLLATSLSIGRGRVVAEALQIGPSRDASGRFALPIEARPRLLFNPDLESSHFFVPGLIGIILQFVLSFLTSFSIVREREMGTLEQLFVTPVSASGLLLGKLLPYVGLACVELALILVLMVGLFGVPISGSLWLLLALSALFIVTSLGLGLMVSTLASTQLEAMQFTFIVMLPSVLLSGFVFPRSEMPLPLYLLSALLPVTYYLEMLRGIVLRGAELTDLTGPTAGLLACCLVIAVASVLRFRKRIG